MRISKGFSLLELLIALAVFSLLAAFAYKSLNALTGAKNFLDGDSVSVKKISKISFMMERLLKESIHSELHIDNNERSLISLKNKKGEKIIEHMPDDQLLCLYMQTHPQKPAGNNHNPLCVNKVEAFSMDLSSEKSSIMLSLDYAATHNIKRFIYLDNVSINDTSKLTGRLLSEADLNGGVRSGP